MSGSDTKQSQEETTLTLLAANHSLQREIAALREVVRGARVALAEIRTLLHYQGRRPEECYAMSVADDAIGAIRRAMEEER